MGIKELLAALREKQAALAVLKDKATSADATEADLTALTTEIAEIEKIEAKLATLKAVDAVLARKAVPASTPVAGMGHNSGEPTAFAQVKRTLTPTEKVGSVLVAMVKSFVDDGDKSNRNILAKMEQDGYGEFASDISSQQKNMNTLTGAAGGFAVPPDFRTSIIDLLMPHTAFLRGNPLVVQMPSGNFRQAAGSSRPTWGYKTEGADTPISTATLRDIDMSAKLFTGMIPITSQVARWTAGQAQAYAVKSLTESGGIALDQFMFLGDGVSPNPLGLLNKVGIGTRAATAGVAPTAVVVDADTRKMLNAMEVFTNLIAGAVWVMPRRIIGYLSDLRTPGGENYAYPTMQGPNPMFKNYPVLETGALPVNGGAGTNEGQIALVSFSKVLMGETMGMNLSISDTAAYVTAGVTNSAFQQGKILIKADMEHDLEIEYAEAVQKLTAVQWGA